MAASSSGLAGTQLESLTPPQITLLAALLLAVGLCKHVAERSGLDSSPRVRGSPLVQSRVRTVVATPGQLPT